MFKEGNAIDTSGFVLKAQYNISRLAKKKIIEDKIPSVTALTTTTGLNAVKNKNKLPDISDLVKKQIMMQQ